MVKYGPYRGYYGEIDSDKYNIISYDDMFKLEEEQEVIIVWSGGNGPHKYIISRIYGTVYALTRYEYEDLKNGNRVSFSSGSLRQIGEYPLTQVFIEK